jgi:hypothetical protein
MLDNEIVVGLNDTIGLWGIRAPHGGIRALASGQALPDLLKGNHALCQ